VAVGVTFLVVFCLCGFIGWSIADARLRVQRRLTDRLYSQLEEALLRNHHLREQVESYRREHLASLHEIPTARSNK
jgi:hypothetical protein